MKNKERSIHKQTGVVLVISLIMLLLLTVIGLTGAQITSLEEKMASNVRDQNITFQAAESTLLEAEKFIRENPTNLYTDLPAGAPSYLNKAGLFGANTPEPDFFDVTVWTAANSAPTPNNFGNNFGILADPRYIIQQIAQSPNGGPIANGPTRTFKITARALGNNAGAQVILQATYEREN